MKSTVSWLYAVIAVLLVALVMISIFLAFKTGFIINAIAMIKGYLTLP